MLSAELIRAYEQALYVVFPGVEFRLGRRSAALDAVLEAHHARTAAFVTAANPRGERRGEEENRAALAALERALGYPYLRGEGRDPRGADAAEAWPAEPSLLVLGIARGEAEALGRALGQNALVYIEKGRAPELVLLRKLRLVLDTQVWLDWLVFDDPRTAALRALLAADRAEIYIDAPCEAELARVLAYDLGRRTLGPEAQAATLEKSRQLAKRVERHDEAAAPLPTCRDPDDQKLLELALAARADCLVTRDRALLELSVPYFQILPPSAL